MNFGILLRPLNQGKVDAFKTPIEKVMDFGLKSAGIAVMLMDNPFLMVYLLYIDLIQAQKF